MLFGTAWIGCHVDGYSFGHATLELHFPCNVGGARTRSCRTGRTSGPHGRRLEIERMTVTAIIRTRFFVFIQPLPALGAF